MFYYAFWKLWPCKWNMYLDETAITVMISWSFHHGCMMEWAANGREKPCQLACQSFPNFLDMGLKATNQHKHSRSRWLPWHLLNLRPMCLDWQMQVNVRMLLLQRDKFMKLQQEEMWRLDSRVKTIRYFIIWLYIISKSLSPFSVAFCESSCSSWCLHFNPVFEAFNAVVNLRTQFVWTPWICAESREIWDVPLKLWHWGHQPVDVLDHQCFLYEQRDLSSRTATRKQAQHVGLWQQEGDKHFLHFFNDGKWWTKSLHTTFPLILLQDFQCIGCLGQDTISGAPLGISQFCLAQLLAQFCDRLHRIRPSSTPSPTSASKSHLQIWIWQFQGSWFWLPKMAEVELGVLGTPWGSEATEVTPDKDVWSWGFEETKGRLIWGQLHRAQTCSLLGKISLGRKCHCRGYWNWHDPRGALQW